ncbi:MAG: DUF2029 domain-containing protein [Dehalococcoidales bacterium]|nr:DUF2029 domain-containing protein [Dehalococcoidales bacterium]
MKGLSSIFSRCASLKPCIAWTKHHGDTIVFVILIGAAAFIRFWAAPLSSGPDVEQFWAFARIFKAHGLDFYRYADASSGLVPFEGWGFVYPPVWLLFLGLSALFVPSGITTSPIMDAGWRLVMKTPVIFADLVIGMLIYWAVPGSKVRKMIFAGLWLLHPTSWFESGVFGQFDAIAALFLLAFVILLIKGKDRLAFLFAGLALMTKQHTFIPIAMVLVVSIRNMPRRRFFTNCAITGGVVALLSLPFLVTGNFIPYARSLFLPGSPPGYQDPLVLSFSGSGSLLTYFHNVFGWETVGVMSALIPVLAVVLIVIAVLSFWRKITPLQAALAGFLLFISLFYRTNYQYLVIYIPLALLLAARTQYKLERVFALVLAMLPGLWVWLANMPWWFQNSNEVHAQVVSILSRIGLFERYLPDYVYVALAVLIACVSLSYIVLVFVKWRTPSHLPDSLLE